SVCPITGLPARYRDPHTSTPFANKEAYTIIKLCQEHRFAWSPLLDGFVHPFETVHVRRAPVGWLECSFGRP
ncbi:hypothetical protein DFJ73DRAFT_609136, partial [Zopfochytrium polystomum]